MITLRNLPPDLSRIVYQKASKEKTSLNKAVISLLEEAALTKKKRKTLHHDLDSLCGSWSKAEASAFERALNLQRRVDPELWK